MWSRSMRISPGWACSLMKVVFPAAGYGGPVTIWIVIGPSPPIFVQESMFRTSHRKEPESAILCNHQIFDLVISLLVGMTYSLCAHQEIPS